MTDQASCPTALLLEAKPYGRDSEAYTLVLAHGLVRYLRITDFLNANVEQLIESIREFSSSPQIKPPSEYRDAGDYSSRGIVFDQLDSLIPNASWEERLRTYQQFGILYQQHQVPSDVYHCFHFNLKLREFKFDRFLESWVKNAWENQDVAESFHGSPKHLTFECEGRYGSKRCIFEKTPFVLGQLALISAEQEREEAKRAKEATRLAVQQQEEEETRRETEDLERLRKSNYHTFVYLMEDLRNGHFKIGRSKTPGKRERTLQSEVPSVTLRFSIPSDEEHERLLHEHFDSKNLRGEWFLLTADELLWIISFLKANGDTARALVDYEWLGRISFQSSVKHENKT